MTTTTSKISNKLSSSQPKLSCVNCGDNLGETSGGVHAFQSFINNAPARIFVEATVKEIYRLNEQPDFKFQYDFILCSDCCSLFSKMFRLFVQFEARQKPGTFLASCCSSHFRNSAFGVYEEVEEDNVDKRSLAADSPVHPDDDDEDDSSKSETEDDSEDTEASEDTDTTVLSHKDADDDQYEIMARKMCPDGNELIFKCADCSQDFKQAVELRTHRISVHQNNDWRGAFKCAVCKNVYSRETTFRRHLFEHLKVAKRKCGTNSKCSVCLLRFANRSALVKHKSSAHTFADKSSTRLQSGVEIGADLDIKPGDGLTSDEEVNGEQSTDLDYVPRADHSPSKSDSEEEEDGDEEEDDDEEEENKARKHKSKKLRLSGLSESSSKIGPANVLTCSDCYKVYRNPKSFAVHRKKMHGVNPTHQCYICRLICPSYGILYRHLLEHKPDPEAQPKSDSLLQQITFKCTDCKLEYVCATTLGKHRREVHGDVERPFKCHLCPLAYKKCQDLKDHMLHKHRDVPLPECKECEKTFANYRRLRLHMEEKHQVKVLTRASNQMRETYDKIMFLCLECSNLELPNEDAYLKHNQDVHKRELFKCPQCPKSYASKERFNKHLEWHKESPMNCDISKATFLNASDSTTHMMDEDVKHGTMAPDDDPLSTHYNNEVDDIQINQDPTTKLFICPQCSLQFQTKPACRFHLKSIHPELMAFECDACSKKYSTMEHLKKHRKNIHRTVKCKHCEFVSNYQVVQWHYRRIHKAVVTKEKKSVDAKAQRRKEREQEAKSLALFKCPDCDETYKEVDTLVSHRTEAHPDDEKLKCPHCRIVSPTDNKLRGHILSHDEGKDWPCGECSSRFLKKVTRNKHLEEVHGLHKTKYDALPLPPQMTLKHLSGEVSKTEKPTATGGKMYKCPECDEEFSWPSNLGNHRVILHGVSESERFKCYHCSSISASVLSFIGHLERHGEKKHLCPHCGKCFTTRDYLNQHVGLMHDKVAGARLRAKYKRSRDKRQQQVMESTAVFAEVANDESAMEY